MRFLDRALRFVRVNLASAPISRIGVCAKEIPRLPGRYGVEVYVRDPVAQPRIEPERIEVLGVRWR